MENVNKGVATVQAAGELVAKSNVVLFGASPVSFWTAKFAAELGFSCLVLDNEPAKFAPFAQLAGVECRQVDFTALPAYEELGIGVDTCTCVLTRGHSLDPQSFVYAMQSPAYYVGMMGRAVKNAKCVAYALEHGCTQEMVDRCTFPIGEKIGAIDAAEIGLSVAAQLVRVNNEHFPREKDKESLHRE